LLFYDIRILVLGIGRLVFLLCADSTPVKKYGPCFSALYLGRRFGFLFILLGQHLGDFP